MKTTIAIMFSIALILGLAGTKLSIGQTVAIGHITAEVIESVSASSNAVTSFEIETPSATTLLAASTSPTVNLGTMTINSGSSATVNVVLKSATVSSVEGSAFTLDPSLNTGALASVAQSNGSQNIQLTGTANLNSDQPSGLYEGSYTVVFAYN